MSNPETPHLQDEEMLRLLDGELAGQHAQRLQAHMEACWTCRTRLEEFQSTIGDYVRYQESVKPLLPPPPAPWQELDGKFEQVDRSLAPPRLLPATQRARVFGLGVNQWVAVAAGLIIVAVALRFDRVPAVSAAELLRKAAAAEAKSTARGRIQVKTRRRTFIRPATTGSGTGAAGSDTVAAGSDTGNDARDLKVLFDRASFSWDEPLSGRSFAAWHDQLAEKRDTVRTVDHDELSGDPAYVIDTVTSASELRRATLTLRRSDLLPLRETLDFGAETVEITSLPDTGGEVAVKPEPVPPVAERSPSREGSPVSGIHVKLQVLAALRRIGADLGEPVEIRQEDARVLVVATGLTASRRDELRRSLSAIPSVEARFEEPTAAARSHSIAGGRASTVTAPMQLRLQALLGGRESPEEFTNRALDGSDSMMARAHALRALARDFSPDAENALPPADNELLTSLLRDHSTALVSRIRELRQTLQPLLGDSAGANSSTGGDAKAWTGGDAKAWQDAAMTLFVAAQDVDQTLSAALAGSSVAAPDNGFERITGGLARLEARAAVLQRTIR